MPQTTIVQLFDTISEDLSQFGLRLENNGSEFEVFRGESHLAAFSSIDEVLAFVNGVKCAKGLER